MAKQNNKEYVTVSVHLRVNGKLKRLQKRTYYGKGREGHCYTLDDFAKTIFMWEHIFDPCSTYAYDGLLQEMEKKLPKKDGETADSVFQKYWVKLKETIDQDFLEKNKGDGEKKYPIFPVEGDYLKYLIASACQSFQRHPLPVKYGFLHFFYKHVMNNSIEEIKDDLNNIPDEIKKIVDNLIVKKQNAKR